MNPTWRDLHARPIKFSGACVQMRRPNRGALVNSLSPSVFQSPSFVLAFGWQRAPSLAKFTCGDLSEACQHLSGPPNTHARVRARGAEERETIPCKGIFVMSVKIYRLLFTIYYN